MTNRIPHIMRAAVGVMLLASGLAPAASAQDCLDYEQAMHVVMSLDADARFAAANGVFAYLSSGRVVDVTQPGMPAELGSFALPDGTVRGMLVDGSTLYVVLYAGVSGSFNGLAVYDLSTPAAPALTGSLATPGIVTQLRVAGSLVLVRNDAGLVTIVDVADPAAPTARGSFGQDRVDAFDVMDGNVFAVDRVANDIMVVSLGDPAAPAVLGRLAMADVLDVQAAYGYLHLFQGGAYTAYDVSDALAPVSVRTLPVIDRQVIMAGERAYAYGLPLMVYDMTDPAAPVLLRQVPFNVLSGFMRGDFVLGGVSGDFVAIDVASPDAVPTPTASLTLGSEPTGVAAYGSYVLVLERMGLDIVDAADCGAPALAATYQMFADNTGYTVLGDYLYVLVRGASAGTTGLHVVDLSDPLNPAQAAEIQLDGSVGGLTGAGPYLYAGSAAAIVVIDVGDPTAPVEVDRINGRFFGAPCAAWGSVLASAAYGQLRFFDLAAPAAPANLISVPLAYEANDLVLDGATAFVSYAGGVDLFDMTEPTTAMRVGGLYVPGTVDDMALAGGYLFVEGHGIHVVDVSDPAAPAIVGSLPYEADRFEGLAASGDCVYYPRYVSPEGGRLASAPVPCSGDTPEYIDVLVDIRPGSSTNPVNCGEGNGVLPVAILTTDTFDALSVDHTTVRFGPDGAMEAHTRCGGGHGDCDDDDDDDGQDDGQDDKADKGRGGRGGRGGHGDREDHGRRGHGRDHRDCDQLVRHEEDVDGDGDLDLLFHFRIGETGIQCGDVDAWLTGMTYDGVEIRGWDKITTVGGNGHPRGGDKGMVAARAPQLAPNPFNPRTAVSFALAAPGRVRAEIYDIAGRRVSILADGVMGAGDHVLTWQGRDDGGRDVPSGVYFVRVDGPGVQTTLRAVLLR